MGVPEHIGLRLAVSGGRLACVGFNLRFFNHLQPKYEKKSGSFLQPRFIHILKRRRFDSFQSTMSLPLGGCPVVILPAMQENCAILALRERCCFLANWEQTNRLTSCIVFTLNISIAYPRSHLNILMSMIFDRICIKTSDSVQASRLLRV